MRETKIKTCKTHGETTFVERANGQFRCRKCEVDRVSEWRRRTKLKAVTYLGGACGKCGYNKCVDALEFHHRDPTQKEIAIAGKTIAWDRLQIELDKCDLLCSNCHREEHASRRELKFQAV